MRRRAKVGAEEPGAKPGALIKQVTEVRPRDGRGLGMPEGMVGGMGMHGGGGAAPVSLASLRTFTSFRVPVFRLYYSAMLAQMAAMNMQMISKGLLVYRLTESASILGLMALANSLPMLFFSLYGGVIADRIQKKYVLLIGEAASAVVIFLVGLSMTLGYLSKEHAGSWWILIVASMAQGAIMGLMMPSRQAIIPEIVGEERLMNAVALYNFGMNLFRLLAPAFAGFFIDAFGFAAIYYTMALMYLIAFAFVLVMPLTGTMSLKGRGALADLAEGFRYIRRQPNLLLVLGVTFLMVMLTMPYMSLLPVFTEKVLNVGARGMGILVSASGVGALLASAVLASLPEKRRGFLLLVSGMVLTVALIGFSFSEIWVLSLVMIAIVGIGQTGRMTLGISMLQYYALDEYRGRVMSIYMMEFGLTSFSVFVVGVLADSIGVQWAIGGLAMPLVLALPAVLVFAPRLRKLD